jgi:SAM-dependent methyltransferase
MLNTGKISPEQMAYEIPEIWENDWFGLADETRVREFCNKIPDDAKSILDVGCGNGLFLHYISQSNSEKYKRICGVDRSRIALSHVKTEKYLSCVDALPFRDREFDIVTSLEVIEHLPVGVYEDSLKELARVAKRYILIGVPFDQDIRNSLIECPSCACRFNADYHLRSFSGTVIKSIFGDKNFKCTEIFYVNPIKKLRPWIFKVYLFVPAMRRIYYNPDRHIYPGYAVCPACGYNDTASLKNTLTLLKQNKVKNYYKYNNRTKGSLKSSINGLLFRNSYQWIGAIYERIG